MTTNVFSSGSQDRLLVIMSRDKSLVEPKVLAGVLQQLGVASDYQVYSRIPEEGEGFGLFCLIESESSHQHWQQDLESMGLECRLYSTQRPIVPAGFVKLPATHILVSVAMTPNAASEKSFNDWYTQEHIPMLSQTPGWLASRRFNLISSTGEAPKHLALHAWVDMSIFERSEYKAAVNTPWRTEVIDQVIQRERLVLQSQSAASDMNDA
ncbi:hypothetical protein K435DRAFT_848705 [Dendrothele bispora CBS 962.96]|uniref:ABM domain-containing protein n=1 Tax=Dendrothele bispora (strain CBS 962.96) TaxID=1314807 RepID=A0A4S8MU99_DENBC|nr:hypothetical protein K435DRAFT_848705 [Dendrothele bispora CBS 962.96]